MEYRDDDRDYMRLPKNEIQKKKPFCVMEDELRNQLNELDQKYETLQDMLSKVYEQREAARDALHKEQVKKMDDVIPKYTAKLERLKAYIESWKAASRGKNEVKFAFRKCEPYKDDFHELMHDPLDWKISEYDLLGFWDHLEIIFDYSDETIKEFVRRWMFENIEDLCFEDDIKELFGFRA